MHGVREGFSFFELAFLICGGLCLVIGPLSLEETMNDER